MLLRILSEIRNFCVNDIRINDTNIFLFFLHYNIHELYLVPIRTFTLIKNATLLTIL